MMSITTLSVVGCRSGGAGLAETGAAARVERIEAHGMVAEHAGAIDRLIWFGPEGGPSLLFTKNMGVPLPADREDDSYTFRGGCYTWVAPQSGWVGPDGAARNWPPDPAMDRGPAMVVGRRSDAITTLTPASRLGLRERKTFALRPWGAELEFSLENTGPNDIRVGGWVNTAVDPAGRIALWMPEGTTLRGWDEAAIGKIESILGPPSAGGWRLLDLPAAAWSGGTKVWIEAPGGTARIGVWHSGRWMVRSMDRADTGATLRAVGEGPVAVYIDPTDGLIEAELYGPIDRIPPGGSSRVIERWEIIAGRFPRPAAADLDRVVGVE